MPQERFVTIRHHHEIPRVLQIAIVIALLVFAVKSIAEFWMMQSMQDQVSGILRETSERLKAIPQNPTAPGTYR